MPVAMPVACRQALGTCKPVLAGVTYLLVRTIALHVSVSCHVPVDSTSSFVQTQSGGACQNQSFWTDRWLDGAWTWLTAWGT